MDNKTLAPLVDADILVYNCGFAADGQRKTWYRENVNAEPSQDELAEFLINEDYLSHALGNTKTVMDILAETFDGSRMQVFLTGSGNFREQVATILPYKGNRDAAHKPKYYKEIRDYLVRQWGATVVEGQEADDLLAATQWKATDDSTVIVSVDKDLKMIPGHHYNPFTKIQQYVTQEQADLNFFRQMLTGDRVDNIPGITGIGDVKAEKLLASCDYDVDAVREEVKKLYQKQYGVEWEGAYNEVGALLWMRRDLDTPLGEVPLL